MTHGDLETLNKKTQQRNSGVQFTKAEEELLESAKNIAIKQSQFCLSSFI